MLITVPGTKWAIRKCSLEEWLKKEQICRMVGGQHCQHGESRQQASEGDSQDTLTECRTWTSNLGDASASPSSSPLPSFPHPAPSPSLSSEPIIKEWRLATLPGSFVSKARHSSLKFSKIIFISRNEKQGFMGLFCVFSAYPPTHSDLFKRVW